MIVKNTTRLLIRLFRNCLGNRSDQPTPGKGRTIRKVMRGGEGNFRFFRYQIPV